MASWNSVQLEVLSNVLGWSAFVAWSISFYPQIIMNFRRKSSVVQDQYRQKYGLHQMIPVAANDVAFSTHAVLVTAFTLFQIAIYDRGNQKVSKTCIAIVSVVWLAAAVCVFVALPSHSWLWLVSCFNTLQVTMTVVKYIPQAVMNFRRKSTVGFSIGNILLDLLGGVANYGQMAVLSIDQNSWVNFYGNIGKTLLSSVSIFFDLLFILQHYVLYPTKKMTTTPNPDKLWLRNNLGISRIVVDACYEEPCKKKPRASSNSCAENTRRRKMINKNLSEMLLH
ncbi:unnamed protein product [Camellia sinensis]